MAADFLPPGCPLATGDPTALPVLLDLLWDRDPTVRELAATCIGYMGEKGAGAAPALRRARAMSKEDSGGWWMIDDALRMIEE
jgi:HEAT repeats